MTRKRLDDDTRFQIALAAIKGQSTVAEICARYGICEATYYRIRDDALSAIQQRVKAPLPKGGREAQLERELHNLKEVVADYAAAIHILKKNPLRT